MKWANPSTTFYILLTISFCISFSNNASLDRVAKYQKFTGDQGLYNQKDDVEILTFDNFKEAVIGSKRAWLIEFYNSWCGFCQRFAPSWKSFATDIRSWRDVVVVAALDCSNEQNYPLCRDYEIMGYPSLRYYHEGFQEESKNYGFVMPRGTTSDDHRHDLLQRMVIEQEEGRGQQFPNLLPYNFSDTTHFFDGLPTNVKYGVIIIQDPASLLGQEVTLDLHKTVNIFTRYAFNNNSDLITSLGVSIFPALYAIGRDKSIKHLMTRTSNRQDFTDAAKDYLKQKHINFEVEQLSNAEPDIEKRKGQNALMERVKKMGDVVFQMDLETALRYSLKREVGGAKEISGEKLAALKKYLQVLANYFPFGKNGKSLLAEISYYADNNSPIHGSQIAGLVKEAEKEDRQVFSTQQKWLGCQGSTNQYRGYPCGLWKMFHYLTVNVADYDQGIRGNNPRLALDAMHGYIKHFFGCADCSEHFQEMAARREIDKVASFDDSIRWLWMAHNEVNKRLSGDETEDPENPKVQFPSQQNCPQCHKSDGSWDSSEVVKYLKHMYSSINVRYLGADTKIIHLGLAGDNSTDSGLLKRLDTKGLQEKDVQVQARPPGKGVANGSTKDVSSLASTKDKALLNLSMFHVLTVLCIKKFYLNM